MTEAAPEPLSHPALGVRHGFFTRRGGVSLGPYASLNGSASGGDDPAHVDQNRARVAAWLEVTTMLGLTQIHGAEVITVDQPWRQGPRADAMVTDRPGLGLVIVTADCAPVLLADARAGVIGAAHAGWRGAVAGVLEATVAAMRARGATAITAAIGPCIGQASYQVGVELHQAVGDDRFFRADGPDRWLFDLAGYCQARLGAAGIAAQATARDTCAEADWFFSHRRRTLARAGEAIGHQMSAIRL